MSAVVDDTYAEAFRSIYVELLITACNLRWVEQAVHAVTGNGSSTILCDCGSARSHRDAAVHVTQVVEVRASPVVGPRLHESLRLDRGQPIDASRQTATGVLRWRISVREDGQRLFYGGLPTLIQWGDAAEEPERANHPVDAMAASGVVLESLQFSHPRPASLKEAYDAIGLNAVQLVRGAPNLVASLNTPLGSVTLESKGL